MSSKKSVLIIEDEVDIQEVIADYLQECSHNFLITTAKNGIEAAIHCHNLDKFDLIISDQHMPYLDGISFLKYIRNEDKKNGETPFLFLSAYIKNIQGIIEDNFNVHFLDKPIAFDHFDKKLTELL